MFLSIPVGFRVFRSPRPRRFTGAAVRRPITFRSIAFRLVAFCLAVLCLAPVSGCAPGSVGSTASPVAAGPAVTPAVPPTAALAAAPAEAALPPDSGVLLAVFGTSDPEALAAYKAIAASYEKLGVPVVWAYTSEIIRAKLAKAGKRPATPAEALDQLAAKGVKNVRVQSLHMAAGEEFSQMELGVYAAVLRRPGRFHSGRMGRPLLESERDMNEVVAAVLGDFPRDRRPGDGIVLMGHGHADGRADLPMFAVRDAFQRADSLVFLATVEGSLDFERVLAALRARGVRRVWLAPFMVVAGDHARNDLAGPEEDSWASRLGEAGMDVTAHLKGLGETAGVRDVFVRHTLEAKQDLLRVKGVN